MKRTHGKLASMAVLSGLLVATTTQGADSLGLYVGAGGGRADLRIDSEAYSQCFGFNCLDASASGWTAFIGLQPHPVAGEFPLLGAEFQYIDFGHAAEEAVNGPNSRRAQGEALFGTAAVQLPRTLDLYAKAGVGLLEVKDSIFNPDPNACLDTNGAYCGFASQHDQVAVVFGWGFGVQLNLSSLALRIEYVRFSLGDGDPDLLSAALLWKF